MAKISLAAQLATIEQLWSPHTVATLNDCEVKLAKVRGEFLWHTHTQTDELFLVLGGALTIRLRDHEIALSAGELFVVPRGVEHQPFAAAEAQVLLLEPRGTVNTGD
ncbi:MAG TPA: cupin domain-containing protein [Dehalococcoidia bacterium]|nr:cupin domain-containing protein [Dehalococcoidia bacterium]